MAHSYRVHFFHLIWAVKDRKPLINPDVQLRLYAYIGGVIKNKKGNLLEIGGMADHVHLLIELNTLDLFSHLIRDIKANSSLWVHKHFSSLKEFAWQEGYGSFSVSLSAIDDVRRYIQSQEQHHKTMTFEEEYLKFLKLHGVKYDPRFVLG